MTLRAPFPWFGGKSTVAADVWQRFGNPKNYVEPFFGSGAILLSRPGGAGHTETVNDKDRFVANFWRAIKSDPEAVAHHADWPVNEVDLTARHLWLLRDGAASIARCDGDPDYFDAKVAGWWVWGACSWIGAGWCSGSGPWTFDDGSWVKTASGRGINRQLPHLGDSGRGINRKLPHLGGSGRGINRKLPLLDWLCALAARLQRVRVCAGDWSRVCGESVTLRNGRTAVFLDPPYSGAAGRKEKLYATDSLTVAYDAREWAIAAGRNPLMRIAFCGYAGEHEFPPDWSAWRWKAPGGYGSQGVGAGRDNAARETIWFSPHCIPPDRVRLLDLVQPEDAAMEESWLGPEE